MASSSKALVPHDASTIVQHNEFLYASNANVSNFVSVKLSGKHNYHLWKTQMLCLMETHDMRGLVDDEFECCPRASRTKIMKQYESLLKGWIFGSISECVLGTVVDLGSAKEVWSKLEDIFVPSISSRQAQVKAEQKEKAEDNDASIGTNTKVNDARSHSAEADIEELIEPNDTDSSIEPKTKGNDVGSHLAEKDDARKKLRKATMQGSWNEVKVILKQGKDLEREPLDGEKNTIVHLAVGIGDHGFIIELVKFISESALGIKNLKGSTALHVAAIVGNRDAAELLVGKNQKLLTIEDNEGERPLLKAYSNKQFVTFLYLWDEAVKNNTNDAPFFEDHDYLKKGVDLLVNAISAKNYSKASEIVEKFPKFATENDEALMAIARTFPNGLDYWETLIYPCSLSDIGDKIVEKLGKVFVSHDRLGCNRKILGSILKAPVTWVYFLLSFLIYMVYLPFCLVYFLWWKAVARLGVPPIKNSMKKKKEWDEAKKLLELLCSKIEEAKTPESIYEKPILEAARQNADQVFDEILHRSPEAIHSRDENGYDFIQLAVIHRSEKIYNLIYKIGERKSHYRTFKDSSGNNILHLVGRLAPSHELNNRTGAALQLQRELQWREELKKLVLPTYITQENIFKETPAMVFTREHMDLVKEGEKWMKTTAESCSITAGLITTIVFAAAITVPGGSNQDTGIPIFKTDISFIIFAASDAISLFASTTALLVFLSVLTARFAEQDFLKSLPRRLAIGFCALLLSTTAMMVSFSTIVYIVFSNKTAWMTGLIYGLAFIPIAYFVALQFSLIVDLYQSTYVRIFGRKTSWRNPRFGPR